MNVTSWPPPHITRRVRVIAWLSLGSQITIVATGALVRLTGSGLGCPTWPNCAPDSLVNTPEMGIHGLIEFGNRLLTLLLVAIAIVAFLFVVRMRHTRKDLFWLTLAIGLGIPAQAIVGGITVLTQLNPYVVGVHFVVSVALVSLATIFVQRVYVVPGPHFRTVPAWYLLTTILTAFFVAVTIVFGIITTGSGPHAGDADAPRNGLNSELLQHVHSWSAYVLCALTIVLVIAAIVAKNRHVRRWVISLAGVEVLQILVGVIQAQTGLPAALVGIHMVLACILVALTTTVLLNCSSPVGGDMSLSAPASER